VFRAITEYAVVDREKVYERLGFIGLKKTKNGKSVRGYLQSYREIPTQLCTTQIFREKIAGGDPSFPTLVEKNDKTHGIPQGAPISDILANIYLIDFDALMAGYAKSLGGVYFRYSDDILVIIPGDASAGKRAKDHAMAEITKFGSEIRIKDSKTSVITFRSDGAGSLSFDLVSGEQGKNGLEYLGFRFDGRRVYLRDSTLSGFYRKITYSLRHEVRAFVARYPGKDINFLLSNFKVDDFVTHFGRVEDFDLSSDYKDWTFWTYARRAAEEFGVTGQPIFLQMRKYKSFIMTRLHSEFTKALSKAPAPII
jgi:hypothetical protein